MPPIPSHRPTPKVYIERSTYLVIKEAIFSERDYRLSLSLILDNFVRLGCLPRGVFLH